MKMTTYLTRRLLTSLLLVGAVLVATACKKDDVKAPEKEAAKVTGISLALTSARKGALDAEASFTDPTGVAGKTAPNALTLDANTTYTGSFSLEDASQGAAKDVTTDYAVSFQATGAGVSFTQSGGQLTVETTAAATGTLQVDLLRDGETQRVSFPLIVRE